MNYYKLDVIKGTLTITKDFERKVNDRTSKEYNLLKEIQADFPNITIVKKSRKSSPRANENRNLTYANMEKYIRVYDNSRELLNDFSIIKRLSVAQTNPYLFVKNWFVKQFPNYKEIPALGEEGLLIVNPILAKYCEEMKIEFKKEEKLNA